jgi:Coatomer gamma subunit appendage platform subdomain
VATIPATLKFTVKDCDPTTGEPDSEEGYNDDYQLEDIDITVSDYVQRVMKVRLLVNEWRISTGGYRHHRLRLVAEGHEGKIAVKR